MNLDYSASTMSNVCFLHCTEVVSVGPCQPVVMDTAQVGGSHGMMDSATALGRLHLQYVSVYCHGDCDRF